jgi:hypothetical protein
MPPKKSRIFRNNVYFAKSDKFDGESGGNGKEHGF